MGVDRGRPGEGASVTPRRRRRAAVTRTRRSTVPTAPGPPAGRSAVSGRSASGASARSPGRSARATARTLSPAARRRRVSPSRAARFSGAAVGSLRAALGGRRGRRRRHPRHRPPQQDEPGGRDQRCALPEERRGVRRHRPGASRPRGSFSPCGGLSTSLGPGPGHAAGRHHVLLLRFSTRFLHREPPTRAANTRSAVTTSACSRSASARYRQS